MKEKLNILIIIGLFYSIVSVEFKDYRDYPACRLGRLQSPIEIKEVDSTYSNDFSFVYQNYKEINGISITDKTFAYSSGDIEGGYINFERGGVIKQYELIRIDIYPGLHEIDGKISDCEVHLIHKKNLDFITNKNQYRSIQDANMYLSVVLRYSTKTNCNDNSQKISCTSDDGLFQKLKTSGINLSLNDYPIFQDKRAFFYEGSSLHIPCDENVNYYVVKDFFAMEGEEVFNTLKDKTIKIANSFDRPIYKNFMNYREVMKSDAISIKLLTLIILLFFLL